MAILTATVLTVTNLTHSRYTGFSSSTPYDISIAPCGTFGLTCDGNKVGRINMETKTITWPYSGFSTPISAAVAPDGSFALVANHGGSNVGRIDLSTGTVTFPCVAATPPAARGMFHTTGVLRSSLQPCEIYSAVN